MSVYIDGIQWRIWLVTIPETLLFQVKKLLLICLKRCRFNFKNCICVAALWTFSIIGCVESLCNVLGWWFLHQKLQPSTAVSWGWCRGLLAWGGSWGVGHDEMGRCTCVCFFVCEKTWCFLLQKKMYCLQRLWKVFFGILISGPTLPREASFASEKGRSCAVESSRIYGIYVLADLEQHTTKFHQWNSNHRGNLRGPPNATPPANCRPYY